MPALPLPGGRDEYKLAIGLPPKVSGDLLAFKPNVVHISAPDILGHRAVSWARRNGIPAIASVHTRFETYARYYKLGFLEPLMIYLQTRLYNRVDGVVTPAPMMSDLLRDWGVKTPITEWARGVNHDQFNPRHRSLEWRRSLGIGDDEMVVGFLSRLVLEKGLDVFADVIDELQRRGVKHRVLIVGKGPAREWIEERLPGDAVFAGFLTGDELGRAVASMDAFLFPSVTETFGNVTLEAMAAGVPVVAANATGAGNLVTEGVTGHLVPPRDIAAYSDALARLAADPALRARMGEAGVVSAQAYHWDRVNQAVVDMYLDVVARRGR